MLVESQKKLEGNARFEGFTIDLADELSKFLQFNYTIKLVDDGAYGSETSPGRAVNKIVQHLTRSPLNKEKGSCTSWVGAFSKYCENTLNFH